MAELGDFVSEITRRVFDLHALSTATASVGGTPKKWTDMVRPTNRLERYFHPGIPASPYKKERLQITWDFRPLRFGPAPGPVQATTRTFDKGPAAARLDAELYVFQIEIVHPDLNYGNATPLYAITRKILTAAGPKLSLSGSPLPYVTGWGPLSGSYDELRPSPTDNPHHLRQLIQLPIGVMIDSASVLGA